MSNPLFDDFFNLDLLTPSDTTTVNNDLFSFFLDNNDDLAHPNSASVDSDTDMTLSSSAQTLDLNALLAAHKQSQKEQEAQTESRTTEAQNVVTQEPFSPSFTQQLIPPASLVDFSTLAIAPSTLTTTTATSAIPTAPPSSASHSPISTAAANSVAVPTGAQSFKSTSPAKRPSPEPAEGARKQAKKEKTPPPKKSSSSSSSSSSKSSPVTLNKDDSLVNTTLSAATLQFLLQKQMEAPLIPQLFTGTLSREEVEDTLAKLLDSTKHLLQAPESTEQPQDDDDGQSSDGEHDDAENEKTTTTHGGLKTQPGIKTDDIPSTSDLKKMTSKERRQLRNKISARNFRVRRKEYIGALEGQVLQHRTEAAHLREAVTIVNDENKRLKEELDEAKRQLSQATISNSSLSASTSPVSQSQSQSLPLTASVAPVSTTSTPTLSKDDQMLLSAILGRSPFNANAKSGMTLTLPTRPQSPIVTFNSQKDMPNSSALAKSGSWKDKGPMFVHSALVPEVTFGQDFQFSDKRGSSGDGSKPWELLWSKEEGSKDDRATENPFAMQSVVLELVQTFTMAMAMGIMSPEEMDATPAKKIPGWMVATDAKATVQDYEADKRVTEALEWELQQTLWEVVAARNKDQASKVKSDKYVDQPFSEDPCMLEWLYESMMARLVTLDTVVEVHSA
ncbi:hypothetical protein BGZ82_009760 [Podila clonocystis]|nr:hypothetical protein BGZ82_009760 [Podila clonocystis]